MTNKKIIMGFLGPAGSFSEEAALQYNKTDEYIAFPTIPKLLKAFWNKEIDKIILPIENSIEGIVIPSIDNLINGHSNCVIEGEIILSIVQNLIGRGGLSEVKEIISHPQALAQCANLIEKLEAKTKSSDSTSAGVELVSKDNRFDLAAVGTKSAAKIYGLKIIKGNIQDSNNNVTRFIILGHDIKYKTDADKTSLIFELNDESGALFRVLEVFATSDINMTNIVSRPSRKGLGKYVFWVDIEGHQLDNEIDIALQKIKERTNFLKILGSYPEEIN